MQTFSFLKPDIEEPWKNYTAESKNPALRGKALASLSQFLTLLSKEPQEVQDCFAFIYLALRFDEKQSLPFHQPLFEKIIGPYLLKQSDSSKPPFLRWVLACYTQFVTSRELFSPFRRKFDNIFTLIDQALEQESEHPWLVQLFIEEHVRSFQYAIHEVPSGVLSGINGATVEDCQSLLQRLDKFTAFVTKHKQLEKFQPLIRQCQFYFQTYLDYLRTKKNSSLDEMTSEGKMSYNDYLNTKYSKEQQLL